LTVDKSEMEGNVGASPYVAIGKQGAGSEGSPKKCHGMLESMRAPVRALGFQNKAPGVMEV